MLEIKSLSFHYRKGSPLFDNLNLEVERGKIYSLLGLNGAGKTTLLKLICGTLLPKSGNIKLRGMDVSFRNHEMLQHVFMIPEDFHLPAVTIRQFVNVNACFYPQFDGTVFNKLKSDFDLPADGPIQNLSYGQKKKFLIAFGIATNVSLLLLDEPTNGLDIPSKSQFRKILVDAVSDHRTFLISSHQVRDLSSMIDQVVIIDKGKIVFNQSVTRISSTLGFGVVSDETPEILYAEESVIGKNAVFKNINGESPVDLELLFNAVCRNASVINQCF